MIYNPFEDTVASGAGHADIIEKIDIGGISLIRAAAKNYKDVVIIPSKNQYASFLKIISENDASTSLGERKDFARDSFDVSSHMTLIFSVISTTTRKKPSNRAFLITKHYVTVKPSPKRNFSWRIRSNV